MKKVYALLLVAVMTVAMAVPTFAANSPEADPVVKTAAGVDVVAAAKEVKTSVAAASVAVPSEQLAKQVVSVTSTPVENFTMRKFSTGNRRENAESRRDGRTLMRKGKIVRFINTISSYGIAYFLLHLFQLMGQDFHVAADLLVGYPGIYLGGFQIRMPQKTAYGLDGHTVREQHGGGVRMPGMKYRVLHRERLGLCLCRFLTFLNIRLV